MSELLQTSPEQLEDSQETTSEAAKLAASGLSRIMDERDRSPHGERDETIDNHGENDDRDSDEAEDDEADYYGEGYYGDYEEEHCGEERTDFDEKKLSLIEIPLPKELLEQYSFLGKLPHGVAVMGGVARSIAREIITGEREPIRDIDLVNIVNEEGESEVDEDTLDELSRTFMPDDYAFGHGIENDTLEHYFRTRDFTVNQSLIMNGKLIVSDYAYNDFQENIIRPTYYEHPYSGDDIGSRLFLKALMMRGVVSQISKSVPLIEDMEVPEHISSFNIALFLNKAMSRSAETARIFTNDLAEWGIISAEYAYRPVALAKVLMGDVYSFEFRPSGDARFKDAQECDDMDGFFIPPAMANYHASNPVIRRAIAEYEDELSPRFDSNGERVSGQYTQAEFDDINREANDNGRED